MRQEIHFEIMENGIFHFHIDGFNAHTEMLTLKNTFWIMNFIRDFYHLEKPVICADYKAYTIDVSFTVVKASKRLHKISTIVA